PGSTALSGQRPRAWLFRIGFYRNSCPISISYGQGRFGVPGSRKQNRSHGAEALHLTWVERNTDQIEKIRAYVSGFRDFRPFPFEYFQGGTTPLFPLTPQSDRGTALLLCFCALYQNIRDEKLMRVLAYLWKEYDTDFFRLNKLPFGELQARIARLTDLEGWELWTKVPGILRSACDFFFRHGKLVPWAHGQADGEACVRIMAEEIFLMGKT